MPIGLSWRFAVTVTLRWRLLRVIADGAAPVSSVTRLRSDVSLPSAPRT